jgi:RNA polymerase sigma-70 factor (ECF subfamily)
MPHSDHLDSATALIPTAAEQTGLAEALALVAQDPDHPAWATIQTLAGEGIRALALRLCGHHDLSDDVVQETLLTIREHAATFAARSLQPDLDARAWIMRVAANTTFAAMRRLRRQQARDLRYALSRPHWSEDAPADLDQAERLAALRTQLSELPDLQRTVIILHHLGGLSFQDVAAELELPIGTAKTHAHRGLTTLRERLSAHAPALALVDVLARLDALGHAPLPPSGAPVPGGSLHLLNNPCASLQLHLKGISMIKALALGLGLVAPLTIGIGVASAAWAQDATAPAATAKPATTAVRHATVIQVTPAGVVTLRDQATGASFTLAESNRQLSLKLDGGAWTTISKLAVGDHLTFSDDAQTPARLTNAASGWGTITAIAAGMVTVQDHQTGLVYQLPLPSPAGERISVPLVDGSWKEPSALHVGDRIRNDLTSDTRTLPPGATHSTGTVLSNDGITVVLKLADDTTVSVPIPTGNTSYSTWTVGSVQTFYQLAPPATVQLATVESNDGTSLVLRLQDGSHETVPIPPAGSAELSNWAPGETVRLSPYQLGQRLEHLPAKTAQ